MNKILSDKNINVALIHDFLTEYGGAERVLEALVRMYPKAVVYTAYVDRQRFGKGGKYLVDTKIVSSVFQKIPAFRKLISPMRVFAPLVFSRFDLDEYDLVISSTNTYFAKAVVVKNGLHICYCHTPPRYLYGYPTARNWKKSWVGRLIGEVMNFVLRQVDFAVSQKPDVLIANSKEVQARIKKFYRRDSEVVYPPVEVGSGVLKSGGDYYLVVSRLARAKRVDLAIWAAKRLKIKLKVVGTGVELESLRKIASKNVEFLGFVPDEDLWKIYAEAKAFIFSAEEEDFGMTPVEAMLMGKPVVALNQGGVKETVVDGLTGVLFEKADAGELVKAIRRFERLSFDSVQIMKHARKFSRKVFEQKMRKIVKERINA